MSISQNFPATWPSLMLDFANSKTLDPRVTFTRASTATYVGADGLIKTAAADEARFDHNPETGESLGLLIEESRINKRTRSEEFDFWGQTNVVTAANIAISPDGQQTADEVYATSNGVNTGFVGGVASSFDQNEWHTFSIFWKAGTSNGFRLQLPWTDPNNAGVDGQFNLSNGELVASPPGGYGNFELASTPTTVTKYPNDWWRVSLTFRPTGVPSSSILGIWIYPSYDTNNVRTTNLTSYFWGAQLEEGSFPTSYIPTTTAWVTRQPDNASITGTNFSSWYNQSEGSFYIDIKLNPSFPVSGKASVPFALSDNSYNNRITLASSTGSSAFNADVTISGTQYRAVLGNYTPGSNSIKSSIGYKSADTAGSLNGASPVTSSPPGTLPLLTRADIGRAHDNINYLSGHVRRITYYPERLTNAQLQSLTK